MKYRSVHSGRLERWLGTDKVEYLSRCMTDGGGPGIPWYGPPINIRDVPGSVWVGGDGDFAGNFDRGFFASAADSLSDYFHRLWREAGRPIYQQSEPAFGVGFASISDALSRASGGFSQFINGAGISKTGVTSAVGEPKSLWAVGTSPPAGVIGSAAPGGRAPTDATTGAMLFTNPASGTLHLVGADILATTGGNSLMLYDRIFDVAKNMNSSAAESVTGVPTRYQSSTPTNADYAGGNFMFPEVITTLAATAHNWDTMIYRDQDGNDTITAPAITGNSGCVLGRFDTPVNVWFAPLATGDNGVMDLNSMKLSAAVATGTANWVIGHPIGIMAFPIGNTIYPFDWLASRQQAPRIFDDACLALFEMPKPTATASTYTGVLHATAAAA